MKGELRRTGDKQMDMKRNLSLKLLWHTYPLLAPRFTHCQVPRCCFALMSFGLVNVLLKAFPANINVQQLMMEIALKSTVPKCPGPHNFKPT